LKEAFVAKATAAGGGGGRGRPPASTPATTGRAGFAVEVYQELRKTTWPTGRELRRMTEVVIATVIIFGLLIGGLDLLLSIIVKPIYTQIGTPQTSATPQQTFTPVPKPSPTTSGTTTTTSAAPGGATGTGTVSSSSSAASAST
jgi:preprotein translocase subunit SecE